MKWRFLFLDCQDGKWTPLKDAAEPVIQFSGYSSPLSAAQFAKLAQPQHTRR